MTRTTFLAAVAAVALVPGAASAQTPAPAAATGAAVTTGATVYDTSGATVGTVASTDGTNAVIDTGAVKAAVPLTSLAQGAKGPTLGMTKAQLDAAAGAQQQQATADFAGKLVPGAVVYGTGGAQLGTIKTVDADGITLTTPQGEAKLPKNGFGPGPQGVTIGMTAAQLASAMGAAAPAADAATTTTTSSTSTTAPADGAATADPAATTDAAAASREATTTTTTSTTKTKKKPR